MRPRHGCMVGGRSYLRGGCRWEGQLSGETRDANGISRQNLELLLGFLAAGKGKVGKVRER